MAIQHGINAPRFYDEGDLPKIFLHETEHPEAEAKFMMSLVEKWGMISGMEDGEDSIGRAKGKLMPVDEVIERAASLAKKTFAHIREAGLMATIPGIEEMKKTIKDRAEAKEEAKREKEDA